jgi:hypothetical protein
MWPNKLQVGRLQSMIPQVPFSGGLVQYSMSCLPTVQSIGFLARLGKSEIWCGDGGHLR